MRDRLERRRLTLRAAALCIVLVLLCGCLLPAFAEGPERTDSVPDQTWDEEIEDEPAWDEEEDIRTDEPVLLPAEGGIPVVVDGLDDIGLPDETPTPDSGAVKADEHFERTYLFLAQRVDEPTAACPTRNRPWHGERASDARRAGGGGKEPSASGVQPGRRRTAVRFRAGMKDRSGRKRTASAASTPLSPTMRPSRRSPFQTRRKTSPFCRSCGKNGPLPRRKRLWMRQSSPKKADPLRRMPTWPTTA